MPFEQGLISKSNFKQLAWSPLTWNVDTTLYPGLMRRSVVVVAFAKMQARSSKIKTFFYSHGLCVYSFVCFCYVKEERKMKKR
jgi:hypothetical protein